uniref:Uncharacterized protein n=1 Tax=Panagrolaimus sp. ES5 TaxID=591445 RepID=A0AC34FA03_9BILA
MADLYEPLAPMDGAQPPPPPPPGGPSACGGGGGAGGLSKESKVFSDNVTGNTAMSAVTDTRGHGGGIKIKT